MSRRRTGIAPRRRSLVDGGVIAGYLLDARSARKLAMAPTGSADGPGNLTLSSRFTPAGADLATMLRQLERGLLVTRIMGGAVNPTTGEYSKAVQGFWIEGGVPVHPVCDVTIAGHLPAMLKGIAAVGADTLDEFGVRSGSILLESMKVAG